MLRACLREARTNDMIKQKIHVVVERVNTVVEELSLEAFLISYDAGAHNPDYYPYVIIHHHRRRDDKGLGGGDIDKGLCRDLIKYEGMIEQ